MWLGDHGAILFSQCFGFEWAFHNEKRDPVCFGAPPGTTIPTHSFRIDVTASSDSSEPLDGGGVVFVRAQRFLFLSCPCDSFLVASTQGIISAICYLCVH